LRSRETCDITGTVRIGIKIYINKPQAQEAIKYAIKSLEALGASHLLYNTDLKQQEYLPEFLAKHKWRLGQVYTRLGLYKEAVEQGFREAQYLVDQLSGTYSYPLLKPQIALGMGEVYLREDRLKEAEHSLNDAVNNIEKLLGAYRAFPARVLRAETYIRQGKLNEASEDCKAIFKIDKKPNNNYLRLMFLTAFYHAAIIKHKEGDTAKADEYLSEFLQQIKPFCESFLDEKTYTHLDSTGAFSPILYNKKQANNIFKNKLHHASEIFSAIYGSSHPFVQDYIAIN
jgi:tetratricopeptide (TPR) repeat protein